jgi:hypothetical protein
MVVPEPTIALRVNFAWIGCKHLKVKKTVKRLVKRINHAKYALPTSYLTKKRAFTTQRRQTARFVVTGHWKEENILLSSSTRAP